MESTREVRERVTEGARACHERVTDAPRITPGFVQILTIIYPQIATKPGPRRDPGKEHNTVQNEVVSTGPCGHF